jgi:NAD-dependent deacetylase
MPLSRTDSEAVDRIVAILKGAQRVLFITGAGLSADSGLPTYRGVGGLYEEATPPEGLPIEAILSGEMIRQRPELTWKYLIEIEQATRGATYNRGHRVIAEIESELAAVWTLTQNVDGFHRMAGSRNVIDIHGDMHRILCVRCEYRVTVENFVDLGLPPACPECTGLLRPDVVLFGEMLPMEKLERLQRELLAGFDLVFSIGTSSLFPYISQPVMEARMSGTPTVEINPGNSEISGIVDEKISAGAAEALDAIWTRFRSSP